MCCELQAMNLQLRAAPRLIFKTSQSAEELSTTGVLRILLGDGESGP